MRRSRVAAEFNLQSATSPPPLTDRTTITPGNPTMRQARSVSVRRCCPLRAARVLLMSVVVVVAAAILSWPPFVASSAVVDPSSTLACHRREYSYRVFKADSLGRKCWDYITVMSCWGRCDSNEVPDWQFPYKLPHHPVCLHEQRELRTTELENCEPEVELGTNVYEYYEAITCSCQICQSTFANCEGLHYRDQRLV